MERNKDPLYFRNGINYRKLGRYETIETGAMQSWEHGDIFPVMHVGTVGDVPASFSDERDFYNPVEGEK